MSERGRMVMPELPANGIFRPHTWFKQGLLFASQGIGTVNDVSLSRAFFESNQGPVTLVRLPSGIVVFDGHHRTGRAIICHDEIGFEERDPQEANLVHIYPFYIFLREMKQRMGRLEEFGL